MDERSRLMGQQIRQLRETRGWSQQDLATRVGVTRQQIGRLEGGNRSLRPDTIEVIARALDVPRSSLEPAMDTTAQVADYLRLLGYEILDRSLFAREIPASLRSVVVAGLRTGPIHIRALFACRAIATRGDVDELADSIQATRFQVGVVVGDSEITPEVREQARRRGLLAIRRDEFLNSLVDLTRYSDNLRMRGDPGLFVSPQFSLEGGDSFEEGGGSPDPVGEHDFMTWLEAWAAEDQLSHVVLLGKPGSGKSTACREFCARLASQYQEDPGHRRVPLLVPLWEYPHVRSLRSLLFKDLLPSHGLGADAMERMLEQGRFVVILDGLDEMSVRSDPRVLRENVRAVAELLLCGSRVLVATRPGVFPSSHDLRQAMVVPAAWTGEAEDTRPIRFASLRPFGQEQIEQYLREQNHRSWRGMLDRIEALGIWDLASLPLGLRLLSQVLAQAPSRADGTRNLSDVVHCAIDLWAEQESFRYCLTSSELKDRLEELAYSMWRDGQPTAELHSFFPTTSNLLEPDRLGQAASLPILRIQAEGRCSFMHQAFWECLLMKRIFRNVAQGSSLDLERFWFSDIAAGLAPWHLTDKVRAQFAVWLVQHPNASIRSLAAFLLGLGRNRRREPALWEAWRKDAEPAVRIASAISLVRQGEIEVLRDLGAGSRAHDDPLWRIACRVAILIMLRTPWGDDEAQSLGHLVSTEILGWSEDDFRGELPGLLGRADLGEAFRCTIVRVAGLVGREPERRALLLLLDDPRTTARLREASLAALDVLKGR